MLRFLGLGVLVLLGGCSVAMASKHKGVTAQEALSCETRSCFLALRDSEIIDSQWREGGLTETYRILLKQGSTGRAVMHGLLDVATIGLWEVAGTPIEAKKGKDRFIVVTAEFDQEGRATAVTRPNVPDIAETEPSRDEAADDFAESEAVAPL